MWLSVSHRDGRRLTRRVHLPGGRADVRDRATTVAMHLVRRLLLRRERRVGAAAVSERLRLFVALDLPAAVRAALAAWCDARRAAGACAACRRRTST